MTEELQPCIFCFGEGVPITRSGRKGRTPFTQSRYFRGYIKCKKCGFTSPERNNPKAMVAAWNRRSPSQQPKPTTPSPSPEGSAE